MKEIKKNHKKTRLRKVGSLYGDAYIRLRGKWLEEAGFHAGDRFTARVQGGRLVLEKAVE